MKKFIILCATALLYAVTSFCNSAGTLKSDNNTVYAYSGRQVAIYWEIPPSPLPNASSGQQVQWVENLHNGNYNTLSWNNYYNPSTLTFTANKSIYAEVHWQTPDASANTNEINVVVYPSFNPGTLKVVDENPCYNTTSGAISFATQPSGGNASFTKTYRWEYSTNNSTWTGIGAASTTASSYTPSPLKTTTWFRCQVNAGAGEITTSAIKITVNPQFSIGTITGGKTICYNTNGGTLSFLPNPSGGNGAYSYQWYKNTNGTWASVTGATASSYTVGNLTATTKYKCYISNTCGSGYTNEVTITVRPNLAPGSIVSDKKTEIEICENGEAKTIKFSAPPSGETGTYVYQWQSSADNKTYSDIQGAVLDSLIPGIINTSTYYRCKVGVIGTCNITNKYTNPLEYKVIGTYIVPKPVVSHKAVYCKNDNATLTLANPNTKNNWYNASNAYITSGKTYSVNKITDLTKIYVEAIDYLGCKSNKTEVVLNIDSVKASFYLTKTNIVVGEATQAHSNSIGDIASYEWEVFNGSSYNDKEPFFKYLYPGVYDITLTVTSNNGCTDSYTINDIVHVTGDSAHVAINEMFAGKLLIYPQPVTNMLNIEYPGENGASALIYSTTGQLLNEQKLFTGKNTIDMSSFIQGAYIIRVIADETVYSNTILKTR